MNNREYINENYKLVKSLKKDGSVMIAKCTIDDSLYVVKNKRAYDSGIYKRLKEEQITGIPKIYEVLEDENGFWVIEEFIQGRTLEEFFGEPEYMSAAGDLGNPVDNVTADNGLTASGYVSDADAPIYDNVIEVDFDTTGIDAKEVIGENASEWMLTNVIESVAKTLHKLHSLEPPIIHRDIKPENIIITDLAEIKLLDFNISRGYTGKAEKDTVAMGTKGFAPPEQYGFKESDCRSDIYSLGATIKYLMAKTNCHSKMLSDFVDKAMAFDPGNRFQNMIEVLYFVKNYDEDETETLLRSDAEKRNGFEGKADSAKSGTNSNPDEADILDSKQKYELEMEKLRLSREKNYIAAILAVLIVIIVMIVAMSI